MGHESDRKRKGDKMSKKGWDKKKSCAGCTHMDYVLGRFLYCDICLNYNNYQKMIKEKGE